jgi:hypothetical protein
MSAFILNLKITGSLEHANYDTPLLTPKNKANSKILVFFSFVVLGI